MSDHPTFEYHLESRVPFDELGRHFPAYRPSLQFDGPYLSPFHEALATGPTVGKEHIVLRHRLGGRVAGWLHRADALKLYELAYFAEGDMLELGCYRGLSALVLSRALRDSGGGRKIISVDWDPRKVMLTHLNLLLAGAHRDVSVRVGDAVEVVREFADEGRTFGLVFVDHTHAYQSNLEVCRELSRLVRPGGFVLFHDYNDERNRDPSVEDYGVYQAVEDGLDHERFRFGGTYGCSALYRHID